MTQIDKYGVDEESPIVEQMNGDEYFVRMVFPLVLTPKVLERLRTKPRERTAFGKVLESEFLEANFAGECAEVYEMSHILPLKPLLHEKNGCRVANMVACLSLPRWDFVEAGSGVGSPKTPAAAWACLAEDSPNLMETAIAWNLLDYTLDNVSVVFELGGQFLAPDEFGIEDVFNAYLSTHTSNHGTQAVLELDNLIG